MREKDSDKVYMEKMSEKDEKLVNVQMEHNFTKSGFQEEERERERERERDVGIMKQIVPWDSLTERIAGHLAYPGYDTRPHLGSG